MRMKKTICLCITVMMLILTMASCAKEGTGDVKPMGLEAYLSAYGKSAEDLKKGPLYNTTVTVYNWGEYMDEELNKTFEEKTGVKVNYRYFHSNETLYSALKSGGASYDVIVPSDYMIALLIEEGLLETIDTSVLSNYQYIMDSAKNTNYDPDNKYSVPYMTGTVGLVYNTEMVKGPVDSWSALFDPAYKGQILMFDNPRDAVAIALIKLGYSFNTTSESELGEAFALLEEQKPLVQAYVMDQIYEKLISGEAAIGPYYAGDAVMMMEESEDNKLAFVHPKEGVNRFIDAFCIPTSVENRAAAYLYIDFMCSLEAGLANVEATGYTTPLSQVYDALDEEIRSNPATYPSEDVLANSETFNNLPANIREKYDTLWSELMVN